MRPTPAFLRAALLAAATLTAQEPIDTAANRRILAEAMERSRVVESTRELAERFGPRLAGSPNYMKAANWLTARFTSFGASRAVLEPWGARSPEWQLRGHSAELVAPYYLRLHAIPKAYARALTKPVRGVPVVLPRLTAAALDSAGTSLRGRIVMIGRVPPLIAPTTRKANPFTVLSDSDLVRQSASRGAGEPESYWDEADPYLADLAEQAKLRQRLIAAGAVATIQASPSELTLVVTGYPSYRSPYASNIPAFVLARGQFRSLQAMLELGEKPEVALALDARVGRDSIGYNVIAEIAGTDPALKDQVVMLGGHLDSWHAAAGATDNATGAALALEVVRIIRALGTAPRRTIRIGLWDGEEQEDYWGSMGWVKQHLGDPVTMSLLPEQARLSAYVNFDHGTGRLRGFELAANEGARAMTSALLAPWAARGAGTVTLRNHGSTDHMPFFAMGIPTFNSLQDPADYDSRTHHTALDGSGWVLEDELKQASAVTASFLWHLANRDAMVMRPPLPKPKR
ncbi:MAG: M28 family peptidase [Gemmatimonadaceae bacterium]|nr:M28 family peptidase [Gemmatimonadaceae bacterium]